MPATTTIARKTTIMTLVSTMQGALNLALVVYLARVLYPTAYGVSVIRSRCADVVHTRLESGVVTSHPDCARGFTHGEPDPGRLRGVCWSRPGCARIEPIPCAL
jgi:hypothetical protein